MIQRIIKKMTCQKLRPESAGLDGTVWGRAGVSGRTAVSGRMAELEAIIVIGFDNKQDILFSMTERLSEKFRSKIEVHK